MDNSKRSKRSTPSSSTHIFEQNDANPSSLPEQHPYHITNPFSFNVDPSLMSTPFPAPVIPQGAQHPNPMTSPPSFNVPNFNYTPTISAAVIPQGTQHPNLISSPPSFNVPNPMHNPTFPAPVTPQGAQHPNHITSPPSFNVPNLMHTPTFPTLVTPQGAQHPNLVSSPPLFNVPNPIHTQTFQAPMIPEKGARYSFNRDGYIVNNTGVLNDKNQTFQGQTFVLEIPTGIDVINSVKQFAQRFQLSLNVLCGHGLISEVDFMYPLSLTTPRSISGCYQIILFSGTYSFPNTASGMSDFTVELEDAPGTYSVGGLIASTMKAASTVTLVVTNNFF